MLMDWNLFVFLVQQSCSKLLTLKLSIKKSTLILTDFFLYVTYIFPSWSFQYTFLLCIFHGLSMICHGDNDLVHFMFFRVLEFDRYLSLLFWEIFFYDHVKHMIYAIDLKFFSHIYDYNTKVWCFYYFLHFVCISFSF